MFKIGVDVQFFSMPCQVEVITDTALVMRMRIPGQIKNIVI